MTEERIQAVTDRHVNRTAPERLLKVSDVANRVRCGTRRIYNAVRNGELRAVRIDGRGTLRFRVEDVDAWLEGLTSTLSTEVMEIAK